MKYLIVNRVTNTSYGEFEGEDEIDAILTMLERTIDYFSGVDANMDEVMLSHYYAAPVRCRIGVH